MKFMDKAVAVGQDAFQNHVQSQLFAEIPTEPFVFGAKSNNNLNSQPLSILAPFQDLPNGTHNETSLNQRPDINGVEEIPLLPNGFEKPIEDANGLLEKEGGRVVDQEVGTEKVEELDEGIAEPDHDGPDIDDDINLDEDILAEAQSNGEQSDDDEDKADARANDPACIECDDGGQLMSCDGNCMRSFHVGLEASVFSPDCCNPLGMPEEVARHLVASHDLFECPNCLSKQHRCYACKKEGTSDPLAPTGDNTVRRCAIYTCGKFYHPRCINLALSTQYLTCPLHTCASSRCQVKDDDEPLIPCRRCPIAYHEACMPKKILASRDGEHGRRLWLAKFDEAGNSIADPVDRSLLYCMKHKIKPGMDNPDHTIPIFSSKLVKLWRLYYAKKFPDLDCSKKILREEKELERKMQEQKKRSLDEELRIDGKQRKVVKDDKKPSPSEKQADMTGAVKRRRLAKGSGSPQILETQKLEDDVVPGKPWRKFTRWGSEAEEEPLPAHMDTQRISGVPLKQPVEIALEKEDSEGYDPDFYDPDELEFFSEEELTEFNVFEEFKYWRKDNANAMIDKTFEEIEESITLRDIEEDTRKPPPYTMPFRKSVTAAKLDDIKVAVEMACDAKAGSKQRLDVRSARDIMQNEDNLRQVLAPFLHSQRYSSYGRHFTNTDLLDFVARKLEPFAEPGDTIVDFSCGANEFVPIFKTYCINRGKAMNGLAYDIISPRRIEDFVKISWFDVKQGMPSGERLIIGLNPPYGKNNVLANKFLDHAISFRPRLVVLIVPPATKLPQGYSIVMEDRTTMSNKSFYIPGLQKIDKGQWNLTTPSFRIIARDDLYPLGQGLNLKHLSHSAWSYSFQPMAEELNRERMYPMQMAQALGY